MAKPVAMPQATIPATPFAACWTSRDSGQLEKLSCPLNRLKIVSVSSSVGAPFNRAELSPRGVSRGAVAEAQAIRGDPGQ